MTRGNQRELARAKNQKKLADIKKQEGSGKEFAKKKESDVERMRAKQASNEAKKQEELEAKQAAAGVTNVKKWIGGGCGRGGGWGLSKDFAKRKESDADKMRQKQQANEERKQQELEEKQKAAGVKKWEDEKVVEEVRIWSGWEDEVNEELKWKKRKSRSRTNVEYIKNWRKNHYTDSTILNALENTNTTIARRNIFYSQ